jgi:hypothetical protein
VVPGTRAHISGEWCSRSTVQSARIAVSTTPWPVASRQKQQIERQAKRARAALVGGPHSLEAVASKHCSPFSFCRTSITYNRPDVRELEFVSALLQTDATLRSNGGIKSCDLVAYLCSRYGVVVDEEKIKNSIIHEMAGQVHHDKRDDDDDKNGNCDDAVLDICQLIALLLIPHLLEATQDEVLGKEILDSISARIFPEGNSEEGEGLTRESLRKIFESYDEFGLSDKLLDEMVVVAGGPAGGSLAQALTGDLAYFNIAWKDQVTTNFEDVMQAKKIDQVRAKDMNGMSEVTDFDGKDSSSGEIRKEGSLHDIMPEAPDGFRKKEDLAPLKRKFTASFVDFAADSYRRPWFIAILYACFVITYFAYVFGIADNQSYWASIECGPMNQYVCKALQGLIKWTATILQLMVLGLFFIFLGSLGNGVCFQRKCSNIAGTLVAMFVIAIGTVVPYFVVRRRHFVERDQCSSYGDF